PLYAYAAILVALSAATRLALLARPDTVLSGSAWEVVKVFVTGFGFDVAAAAYFCIPFAIYLAVLPHRVGRTRWHKVPFLAVFVAFVYLLLVVAAAEWVFWDEFASRFNFIAVDYLVYTHEVLGNIWESYPIAIWLSLLAIPAIALGYILARPISA